MAKAKKKTQIVELYRNRCQDECHLDYVEGEGYRSFCWRIFEAINPEICKGLRRGQTRKLIRTQLPKGFKLERK